MFSLITNGTNNNLHTFVDQLISPCPMPPQPADLFLRRAPPCPADFHPRPLLHIPVVSVSQCTAE